MHTELLLEWLREVLAKEVKGVQDRFISVDHEQLLLKALVSNGTFGDIRYLKELLQEDNNQFNHLNVLLISLFILKTVS